jgi:hypothetical protein
MTEGAAPPFFAPSVTVFAFGDSRATSPVRLATGEEILMGKRA